MEECFLLASSPSLAQLPFLYNQGPGIAPLTVDLHPHPHPHPRPTCLQANLTGGHSSFQVALVLSSWRNTRREPWSFDSRCPGSQGRSLTDWSESRGKQGPEHRAKESNGHRHSREDAGIGNGHAASRQQIKGEEPGLLLSL